MITTPTIFTGCDSRYWKQYGQSFVKSFKHYNLDRDTFINNSKNYSLTHIDKIFCDHTKKSSASYVITGKGTNKWSKRFLEEQRKWIN